MELKEALAEIYKVAQEKFQIESTPKLVIREDEENANGIFGKTAYYEPAAQTVVLYTTNRHPKDIMRSFSHEMIHHMQNLEGRLGNLAAIEPYIGKYYSTEYVRRKILRQTDSEIIEIDAQIDDEIDKGILPDPASIDPVTGEPIMSEEEMGMGEVPMEPDLEAEAQAVDAQYSKDTKKAEI